MSKCPECGNSAILSIDHEKVCSCCGYVIDDIEFSKEFISESRKELATMPYLAKAEGYPVHGRIVNAAWLSSTHEKTVQREHEKLTLLGQRLNLPKSVVVDAQLFYNKVSNLGLTHSRNPLLVEGACMYAACLQHKIIRTHLEIALKVGCNPEKLFRYIRLFQERNVFPKLRISVPQLIDYFGDLLSIPIEVQSKALKLYHHLEPNLWLQSLKPIVIASSLLYIACLQTKTPIKQQAFSHKAGVHEVTLRRTTHRLLPYCSSI